MFWTTAEEKRQLLAIAAFIQSAPSDVWFDVDCRLLDTQEEVRRARALFPGSVWKKRFSTFLGTWKYTTTYQGFGVLITGCAEAPPTCRAIKTTRTVTKRVPVAFEDREVTEEVVEWDCGGDSDA